MCGKKRGMNAQKQKKILVGMSGGVDSSVAAALLVEQGYDVTGAYMVNFDSKQDTEYGDPDLKLECWRDDYRDAVRVAAHLGIKLIRLDFTKEYRDFVLGYMFDEYKKGRTPNPDVMCNKVVKFDAWIKKAKELGYDALATGHYAKKIDHQLVCAKDENKDQTYFLHQLSQEQLAFAEFPLGEYTKDEVRELAKKFDLPTADKAESMGICFVGEVPMAQFLQQKIEKNLGPIILEETGEQIGEHSGLPFYTIGQRSIAVQAKERGGKTKPLYVLKKNHEDNTLIVGYDENPLLYTENISLEDLHWIGEPPQYPLECQVRLRHRQPLQACSLSADGIISCKEKQKAVTPGQFAVIYKDGVCLGGGTIR